MSLVSSRAAQDDNSDSGMIKARQPILPFLRSNRHVSFSSARDSATEFEYCEPSPQHNVVEWSGCFGMHRGGKVVFSLTAQSAFIIALVPESGCYADATGDSELNPWIGFRVNKRSVELVHSDQRANALNLISACYSDQAGYQDGSHSTYWISYDPETSTLKYGQNSPNCSNVLMTCCLQMKEVRQRGLCLPDDLLKALDVSAKRIQLQSYQGPPVIECKIFEQALMARRSSKVGWVIVDSEPLIVELSPRLMPNRAMTLQDLNQVDVSFEANLPFAGQNAARKVLQNRLTLENATDSNSVSLAVGIGYSLKTEGAFLNTLLKNKREAHSRGEFQMSPETVGLTIGLAPALGNSPGPSVVLEILPPGHIGLAHDNACTHGAFRLLHGDLDVALFDNYVDGADVSCPHDEVEMGAGDAMWFSPSWYQTFAFSCASNSYCCVLLAREYAPEDEIRWPYCRFKDASGRLFDMRPKPDCSFSEMSAAVLEEVTTASLEDPSVLEEKIVDDLTRSTSLRTEAWVEAEATGICDDRTIKAFGLAKEQLTLQPENQKKQLFQELACWAPRGKPSRLVKLHLSPVPEVEYAIQVPRFDDQPSTNFATLWP